MTTAVLAALARHLQADDAVHAAISAAARSRTETGPAEPLLLALGSRDGGRVGSLGESSKLTLLCEMAVDVHQSVEDAAVGLLLLGGLGR